MSYSNTFAGPAPEHDSSDRSEARILVWLAVAAVASLTVMGLGLAVVF